ncbi:MAG: UPF0280 family protein [Candidatus Marinimicrobia bacterium]|nr:UPF0280 family protein [Candidatus Neomarinimicrobiota bacterium]
MNNIEKNNSSAIYQPRVYRYKMGERFASFTLRLFETDIWVGYNKDTTVDKVEIYSFVEKKCILLRKELENYILIHPEFKYALVPLKLKEVTPEIVREMAIAAEITKVGPMAGVAGAFAEYIGKTCKKHLGLEELIIENGGDDYIDVSSEIRVSLNAGANPVSEKIHLIVPPDLCPLGLCASSGTFGHSLSFGSADLVSVACKSTILADQYATYFANKIHKKENVEDILDQASQIKEILHIAVIKDDIIGIKGKLKISL